MEVILIKDVENLGYANDIVNVRPGYANNYLIPQGFAKAEEEKIFGAVTAADLAAALQEKGIEVDRKNIVVDSVKTLGEYEAVAKLHREVKATIKFAVVAE